MSLLLVGPSGIGKDIAMDAARKIVEAVGTVPVISGKTIEYIKQELLMAGDPACCFTPANELTAFLGGKDYQKSMVQELTDLLSTGSKCDVSTKSEGKKYIMHPTVTIQAGSTAEWLHKAMPENSSEGGFLPRFVVICESYGKKHIPFVKYSVDLQLRRKAELARGIFLEAINDIAYNMRSGEIYPTADAMEFYTNWYHNRFSYFSPAVVAYANRSRDHLHRVAMLMAVSRKHTWLEEVDYRFGAAIMELVAENIEEAIKPKKRL